MLCGVGADEGLGLLHPRREGVPDGVLFLILLVRALPLIAADGELEKERRRPQQRRQKRRQHTQKHPYRRHSRNTPFFCHCSTSGGKHKAGAQNFF